VIRFDRFLSTGLLVAVLAGSAAAWAQSPSQQRVNQAVTALEEARRELQSAQNNASPSDWNSVGGADGKGNRVPSASFQARIEALEEKVKKAEAALEEAKRAAL
jgi:hypothetical protein